MTSTHPQIVDLNLGKCPWHHGSKNDLPKPTDSESLLAIHTTITKRISQLGDRKTWGKLPACSQGKKWPLPNPKIVVPFFPFAQQHRKQITGMEKWRKRQEFMKGKSLAPSTTWESPKHGWEWARNEIHWWIMAWELISKHLIAPQVKNTFPKNGWSSQFEIDSHTFPIPMK